MNQDWSNSWYTPGNWSLPAWWTGGPPGRGGRASFADQARFYNSPFVRNTLGHTGGMTAPPKPTRDF